MENAIEIVEKMIKELLEQCDRKYYIDSNYTETHDKIAVLDDVIKKLSEAQYGKR